MAVESVDEQKSLWASLSKKEQQAAIKQLREAVKDKPLPKQAKKQGQFELRGYLRCELAAADKEAFREWEGHVSAEECYSLLVKAADSGYLIKIGDTGQGATASLSANTTGTEWDGYVLVAHAGNSERAAKLVVYKHEIMMERNWSPWLQEEGEDALR